MRIHELLDTVTYPLDGLGGPRGRELIARCELDLERSGMFNLEGFVRPRALARCVAQVEPVLDAHAFLHKRDHNIYFEDRPHGVPGDLPGDHPALARLETVGRTVCADQIADGPVCRIYEWPPLAAFLARVMGKPRLHVMADPLARVNVMSYRDGETLNWHFDRSEFTTTLLLQAPASGGAFEYREALRSEGNPNYDGVARLLAGGDPDVKVLRLEAGTLNVFRGKNTAHRVTPVRGERQRIVAVFSYYEEPGRLFSESERLGFYGRAA